MASQDLVVIKGAKETMAALKQLDPVMAREVRLRVNREANRVLKSARSDVPSGFALVDQRSNAPRINGWGKWAHKGRDLGFSGASVRKNMRLTRAANRRRGRVISNLIGVVSDDGPGVIWQTAGRGTSKTSFVFNVFNKYGAKRGIWRAFDADRGLAVRNIEAALQDGQRRMQEIMDNAGAR